MINPEDLPRLPEEAEVLIRLTRHLSSYVAPETVLQDKRSLPRSGNTVQASVVLCFRCTLCGDGECVFCADTQVIRLLCWSNRSAYLSGTDNVNVNAKLRERRIATLWSDLPGPA